MLMAIMNVNVTFSDQYNDLLKTITLKYLKYLYLDNQNNVNPDAITMEWFISAPEHLWYSCVLIIVINMFAF